MKTGYRRLWLEKGHSIRSSTGVELRLTPSKSLEPLGLAETSHTFYWLAHTFLHGSSMFYPAVHIPEGRSGSDSRDPSRRHAISGGRGPQFPSAEMLSEERHWWASRLSLRCESTPRGGLTLEVMHFMTGSLQLVIFDARSGCVIGTAAIPGSLETFHWGLRIYAALEAKRAAQHCQVHAPLKQKMKVGRVVPGRE